MSAAWRKAPRHVSRRRRSRRRRAMAKCAASRNSSTPPTAGAGSAASCHQPRPRQRPIAVPGPLLPARTGGKPYQGLEIAPRRRPDLMSQGHRQPVPPVPARRRLLAAVEPARTDASTLVLAGRALDTLRLRLIKVAARIVEMKTKIKVHLPTSAPNQSILHLVLGRLPRLVT